MSAKAKIGVLISGRGSNLKSLIAACADPNFPAQIVLVISNVANAGGLAHASNAGIAPKVIPHKGFPSREAFDAAIDDALNEAGVEIVCEAGFMRIHSEGFVRKWQGRIINIHPSLLPSFKGTHVHEQAIAAGVKMSGCTVHFVAAEVDSGPIIAQSAVPVLEGDTPESLAARVLEEEHKLYPLALKLIVQGRVRFDTP
jgi:phosphoribosylglycinamide formyltransferase-1